VRVRIQVGGCSGLGAANGYRHTQLRGAVVDSERLEAEGRAQELRGEDRQSANRPSNP
jgi:hypothetical protein